MDGYLDRLKCLKRSKARQRCSTLAYGNRSRFSGAEHMLAGAFSIAVQNRFSKSKSSDVDASIEVLKNDRMLGGDTE